VTSLSSRVAGISYVPADMCIGCFASTPIGSRKSNPNASRKPAPPLAGAQTSNTPHDVVKFTSGRCASARGLNKRSVNAETCRLPTTNYYKKRNFSSNNAPWVVWVSHQQHPSARRSLIPPLSSGMMSRCGSVHRAVPTWVN
jgi:hypothetical protein